MASKVKKSRRDETPAERFERVANAAIERGKRSRARREQKLKEMAAANSRRSS